MYLCISLILFFPNFKRTFEGFMVFESTWGIFFYENLGQDLLEKHLKVQIGDMLLIATKKLRPIFEFLKVTKIKATIGTKVNFGFEFCLFLCLLLKHREMGLDFG